LRDIKPEVFGERATLATSSYMETEAEPAVIRRAKAIDRVVRGMSIYIDPNQLIVGNHAPKPRGAFVFFPEVSVEWTEEDLGVLPTRLEDPFVLAESVRKELEAVFPYWRGKSITDKTFTRLPEDVSTAIQAGAISVKAVDGIGHHILDYSRFLSEGVKSIRADLVKRIQNPKLTEAGAYQKWVFWRALVILCDAVVAYATRYAEEAKRLAAQEPDETRQKELEAIAGICEWVPANPARTFHEALQVVWFVTALAHISQNGAGVSVGRLDQFLYPFYRNDIDQGRISQSQAQELLECLWAKFDEINKMRPTRTVKSASGYLTDIAITLGGQDSMGGVADNELTYMCLEAHRRLRLRAPQVALRVHNETGDDLLIKAIEVQKAAGGAPELLSDNTYIPAMLQLGLPIGEARDYSVIGCSEPAVAGTRIFLRSPSLTLPSALELALNQGVHPRTGEQVGVCTADPLTFASFDQVLHAFEQQVRHLVSLGVTASHIADSVLVENLPHPFLSLVTPDCIERGLDVTAGGARYDWTGFMLYGLANAGDSLAAIKRLVFDESRIAMAELMEALAHNFEGREKLRQMLLHAPKYGNDDDYVDALTRHVVEVCYAEVAKYRNARGNRFTTMIMTLSANVSAGEHIGATPDGRKAGQPLADGMSPTQGTCVRGITASLRSAGKMDLVNAGGGVVLNEKVAPALLNTDKDIRAFVHLNRAFLNELGGMHVQYNVISSHALREAQKHPEQYRDLMVRVVGYSAYFTELSKQVQDDIISRSEHETW